MSLNFLGIWCVIQLYMKDETPAMGLLEQELEELKKKAPPPPKPPKIGPNANTLAREVDRQRQVVQRRADLHRRGLRTCRCAATRRFRQGTALRSSRALR